MAKNLLKTLVSGTKRFVRDEEGQSTTEYILILAIAVMVAMKFKQSVGTTLESATQSIDQKIQGALQ